MKFSELWLHEWVNPTIDGDALANQVTMAGLEVDGVEPVVSSFHGVVVSEAVECAQHPNADKLRVTRVNVGGGRLLDIVYSASDRRQGLCVAVAATGAVLPGDFKIKAAKLRDELPEGMLHSFPELGISDGHNGIIGLLADAPIDIDIREHLKLDDNTAEISVTPSRTDCLDIIDVARNVTVLNQLPLIESEIVLVGATTDDMLSIVVKVLDTCPCYLGRVIKDINVRAPAPLQMKGKLHCCGIRSIDAVVDVTNCVLLELGQPTHAFGKGRVEGDIVVRMAKEGETLVLPDGTEAELNADTLIIANHNEALVIGDIFGGEYSGVNDETQDILLECVLFSPLSTTGHTRRHGLYTGVSHHYERGVGLALQHKAVKRATRLLIDICGGEAGPVIDITSEATLSKRTTITLRHSKLDCLIGHHIADEQITDILRRPGREVIEGKDEWQAVTPSWRFDTGIEKDLVEEVVRVYGCNDVPDESVQTSLVIGTHHEVNLSLRHVKALPNSKGYQKMIICSLVDPKV